jgi:predicted Zn-dependent peptidase
VKQFSDTFYGAPQGELVVVDEVDMLYDEQLEAKIQALTVDQINAAFRRYVDPAAVTIVKAGNSIR